jgi:S1-C subfamily serine protease
MLGDVNDSDYESLSFGVYSNVIKNVAENIIANGSYSKPLVGVTVTDVGAVIGVEGLEWIAENKAYSGLYIVSQEHNVSAYDGVSPNSAAAKAGMKSGEVIYKAVVNGVEKEVSGLASLSYILFQLNNGDSFQLCTINSSGVSNTYTIDLWS